jgi:hypothetical protein
MLHPVSAQLTSTWVELATLDGANILFHVRVLRGQTIESASVQQGDNVLELETSPVQLPNTQWIVLDASEEMVNLQTTVQGAVQRFLRNNETPTGLIIYNSSVDTLSPTNRTSQIDSFLLGYTATAGEPACLADALIPITEATRELDHSWRILVITAGDFSGQTNCAIQTIPAMPAPVDVIAITDEENDVLQDLVDTSDGTLSRANLRTVEARITEIRTQWGQPTYALSGVWSDEWNVDEPLELTVTLANGTSETKTIRLREYRMPVPIEPTAAPTQVVLATITPQPEETEAAAIVDTAPTAEASSTSDTGGTSGDNIALLLIVGAVLFIIGAVILALALSRMRRPEPYTPQPTGSNFYDTIDEVESSVSATRIRERDIIVPVNDSDNPTRAAQRAHPTPSSTEHQTDETYMGDFDVDAEDEMLITQVLTDKRFRNMMEQSVQQDEVVAWIRVEGSSPGDFELTQRGAIVGRSQECDIQIKGDRAISRQHARLEVQPDKTITISRLSAVNPVIVGGLQVGNHHELKSNDVIHLSDRTRLILITRTDELDEEITRVK